MLTSFHHSEDSRSTSIIFQRYHLYFHFFLQSKIPVFFFIFGCVLKPLARVGVLIEREILEFLHTNEITAFEPTGIYR